MMIRQIDPARSLQVNRPARAQVGSGRHAGGDHRQPEWLPTHARDKFLTASCTSSLVLNNEGVVTFLVVAQGGLAGDHARTAVDASYL